MGAKNAKGLASAVIFVALKSPTHHCQVGIYSWIDLHTQSAAANKETRN